MVEDFKLDYSRLNEVLNGFGLSLKVENGNAIFIDDETKTPMKLYAVFNRGLDDESVKPITEAEKLLDGGFFYVDSEDKHFQIYISPLSNRLSSITKTERKGPHLYERTKLTLEGLECPNIIVEESTFRRHTSEDGSEEPSCDYISDAIFAVDWRGKIPNLGQIKVVVGNKIGYIYLNYDPYSDEKIITYYETTGDEPLSKEEARQLIEQSQVLKNTIGILYPVFIDHYFNISPNDVITR